jgi:hypothetical protein
MSRAPSDPWDRLVDYANSLGWSVVFRQLLVDSAVCPETLTIQIARCLSAERRVFDLAHEIGHVLCGHQWDLRWPHNMVREEYEAWAVARALLRRKRIRVNPWQWERHVSRALRSHMRFALRAKNPVVP